jgi:hypothetical protein
MTCIYPLMGYLTDKFGCRTVAASGVLITNNQYGNHRSLDLRVREGLNRG